MITVHEAVNSAVGYVEEFGHLLPSGSMRLEETEFDDGMDEWRITLSFSENLISGLRSYKLFKVDANDGSIRSMTVRRMAA